MLRPFCFVLLVCSQINLWSQNTGTLTGQVQVDGVEFQDRVNIILEQDGEFVMAGSARIGRPYFIEHLPEGNYDVSFVPKGLGMRASQDNVPIEAGKMTNIDVLISADAGVDTAQMTGKMLNRAMGPTDQSSQKECVTPAATVIPPAITNVQPTTSAICFMNSGCPLH